MAARRVLILLLAVAAPLLVLANDTPAGGCKYCSGTTLAYAHIPSTAVRPAGVLPYFRFGESVVSANGSHESGAFLGNRNYVYLYATSDGQFGSGSKGRSVVDNLLPPEKMPANISSVDGPNHCCEACAATPGCLYYAWYPNINETFTGTFPTFGGKAVTAEGQPTDATPASFSFQSDIVDVLPPGIKHRCNLLGKYLGHFKPSDYSFQPTKSNGAQQDANPKAILGGTCNPTMADDPHLVGARGTKFDFSGGLRQPFCLVTDANLHVNVLLDGYGYDAPGANATQASKQRLRTWIKEVGIVWRHDGVEHTAHLVARRGKQQERGNGFLQSLSVDGASLPVPAPGASVAAAGGFELKFVNFEKKHVFDVEHFFVTAGRVLQLDVRMRVAHPRLQGPDDAQAHFNLGLDHIEDTPAVHGVLGQTYRQTAAQSQRAARFQQLARSLSGPLVADEPSGRGFLDGEPKDYVSSGVLNADCKFSAFGASGDDAAVDVE